MSVYLDNARDFLGKGSHIPEDDPNGLAKVDALLRGASAFALVSIAESLHRIAGAEDSS